MASLSPVHLGTIITVGFLPVLAARPLLLPKLVESAPPDLQPRRAFLLDFSLNITAALLINLHNWLHLGFPPVSLASLFIGCIISGFFIGLNSSLRQERKVITTAIDRDSPRHLPKAFFPMTRKFSFVAVTTSVFVGLVLIMVFTRDVDWLANNVQDAASVSSAKMSVIYEILFIMGVLLILLMNLIFSYSKNLKLLFDNETRILEKVRQGDLSETVPVATSDEFGIIAGHTNHMIEGLRHRFELVSELKMAEEVQQNLLPAQSPYLKHFDISGASIYCDQTGGDYYDYILLPGDRLGVVVADVCGHGIGSAMLMTSVRAYLVSAIQDYSSPADLLNRINTYITRDCSLSGRFTSMFFVELNQQDHRLRWVRCGHEPALRYHRESDSFSKLQDEGLVLGVDDSYSFRNSTTDDILPGDILLIGTDGIQDTRNRHDEMFGQERIREILRANRNEPARVIQEALVASLDHFRGGMAREDDATLVIIKAGKL